MYRWALWQLTCERTSQFHELSTNGFEQPRANEGQVKAASSPIWWMRDWLRRRIRWIASWHTPASSTDRLTFPRQSTKRCTAAEFAGRQRPLSSLADSGLLVAALNRGNRHHSWAIAALDEERKTKRTIVVPEAVAGETYAKLRYDRRISGRSDGRTALSVFGLIATSEDLFEVREIPRLSYRRSIELLAKYVDQAFSWVDAIVLLTADDDRRR